MGIVDEDIERLRSTVSIVDTIQQYVALKRVGRGGPVGARAMGACCRRQSARHDGADKPWKLYSDREEEWTAPSTTAQRDRRLRPSTVSLNSGELEQYR